MNSVNLIGRLSNSPEIRHTTNNQVVCRFTLAVTRRFKNPVGDYAADFINCVAFGKTAELIGNYVEKGQQLAVEGRIQTGSYTAQDGSKRYTTDVVVENITFINSKGAKKEQNNTEKEQETVENEQMDVFADFGENVEIDDNFLE